MSALFSVTAPSMPGALSALSKRLHFYIGLLVGPFLLIAALSGMLYAMTPQLENLLYADALHSEVRGPQLSLAAQVEKARQHVGPGLRIAALRPAPGVGDTTRVMFSSQALGEGEHRAVFIDPVSGAVRGDLTVYGTGGVLPLRTWIDQFHRGLLLGDAGRIYSELAASWLWVAALGGLVLWVQRKRPLGKQCQEKQWTTLRSLHRSAGLWLLLGLLFFSATGLTWSQYAGSNIGVLRGWYGWSTPSVATTLTATPMTMPMPMDEHAEHHLQAAPSQAAPALVPELFDQVLAKARSEQIASPRVEIRPATSADKAWVVSEIDRRWPTRVDAIAIEPHSLAVVDHVRFAQYSLAAKLTRWGIDAHMGVLFGLANQLLLLAFASGLVLMVILGYWMWWRRRPTLGPQPGLLEAWLGLGITARGGVLLVAAGLGVCLPVMGCSLLGLLAWEVLRSLRQKVRPLAQGAS